MVSDRRPGQPPPRRRPLPRRPRSGSSPSSPTAPRGHATRRQSATPRRARLAQKFPPAAGLHGLPRRRRQCLIRASRRRQATRSSARIPRHPPRSPQILRRMILELPHEVSLATRERILRDFCRRHSKPQYFLPRRHPRLRERKQQRQFPHPRRLDAPRHPPRSGDPSMGFPRPRHAPPVHQFGQVITGNPRYSDGRPMRDRSTSRTSRQHDGIMVPYLRTRLQYRHRKWNHAPRSRLAPRPPAPPSRRFSHPAGPGHCVPPHSFRLPQATRPPRLPTSRSSLATPFTRLPADPLPGPTATKETQPLHFTGFSHIRLIYGAIKYP